MSKINFIAGLIIALILFLTSTAFGIDYCENDSAEARAFIKYANETPANDANVSIKLWNGTQTTMTFTENGMYQYNFTAPAYTTGGKNVYFFYINSSNPTTCSTGEFTVRNCDKLTTAQNNNLNDIKSNSDRILNVTEIKRANINDTSATTTHFKTTLNETSDFWNRMALLFTSGANKGQMRRIKDFTDGGTGAIKIQTPLDSAPADGDAFVVVTVRAFLTPDIEDLADAVWDENITDHNSTGSFGESQQNNFKVQMSDFKAIVAGKSYYAKLNSFNYKGTPTNLSELPTITIYDSLRNVIVNEAQLNYSSNGLYTYNYTTLSSATGGLWESVILSNYSDNKVYLNDYWQISSSPADVEIIDIIDTILPSIVAKTEITNMGTQPSDFEYVYCIVTSPQYKCGDGHDIDYQSGTRYILAGHVWNAELGLEVTNEGIYYFKLKAKALGETNWAGASKMFNASFKREGHYRIPDISKECIINTDCPVGYFCYENKCKRLICKENEQLSQDGHSCIEKIEPEKHTILWLIVLAFAGFMLFLFIIFKREEEICVMGKTYGG